MVMYNHVNQFEISSVLIFTHFKRIAMFFISDMSIDGLILWANVLGKGHLEEKNLNLDHNSIVI